MCLLRACTSISSMDMEYAQWTCRAPSDELSKSWIRSLFVPSQGFADKLSAIQSSPDSSRPLSSNRATKVIAPKIGHWRIMKVLLNSCAWALRAPRLLSAIYIFGFGPQLSDVPPSVDTSKMKC
jgi:hypothetical protein